MLKPGDIAWFARRRELKGTATGVVNSEPIQSIHNWYICFAGGGAVSRENVFETELEALKSNQLRLVTDLGRALAGVTAITEVLLAETTRLRELEATSPATKPEERS